MPIMRVYELAKEMDMNSKALLDTMIELGLPMKNHMSTIPGNEVSRIRAMVLKHLGDPNAEPIPRPVEKKEKPPLSGLRSRPGLRDQAADQSRPAGSGQNQQVQGAGRNQGFTGPRPARPGQGQIRSGQGNRPEQGRPEPHRPEQGRSGQGGAAPNRYGGQQGGGFPQNNRRNIRPGMSGSAGMAQEHPPGATAAAAPRQPGESINQGEAQAQARLRRQPGESISPQDAQAQARARRQPGESISPQEAQTQVRARRQPGESISPQEAQAQVRARRQPGDSISPREAQAQVRARRQPEEEALPQAQQAPEAVSEAQENVTIPEATPQTTSVQTQEPVIDDAAPLNKETQAAGTAPPQRQEQPGPQAAQDTSTSAAADAAKQGQGFGLNKTQTVPDKFSRYTGPAQGQAKQPKPKKPQTPVDNKQRGFNKGPKAPVIGRDTADQLSHLGSTTEEDSRFLNKIENAVGDKAYDRGGITRTPSRKQTRSEDSRTSRPRSRSGRDRNRQSRQEPTPVVIKNITLDGPTTVMDFAHLLGKKTGDVIKKLISYGIMASINQELDLDTLTLLGQDFGTQVEARVTKEDILIAADEPDSPENLTERPPVVTIMGHVDHGKTSLLDAIRHANVQASEAGGITQHIGAYQVEINNRKITFLDTPGHEAFTAMRARGAQCTDIAILVVAADDGVMPQTVEAINHAKAAGVPIIVAVNKMDKEGANPERIKQELTEHGLLAEEWGGDTVFAEVSAKTLQGLDQLLEMILLVADVGELKANPSRKAKGVVIEAKLDKGRGPVATVLVQNGTLESGDYIIAGTAQGRIRAMNDENGRLMKQAGPSMPVEVIGLSEVPLAGDTFQVVADERLARQIASERTASKREEVIHSRSRISLEDLFMQIQTGEVKDLNIIIKADVQGSIEALKTSLEKMSNDEVRVQTIHQGVGGITEADVDFASASNAIILGFNVRPDVNAKKSAETNQVDIRLYSVIYNAIEDVKSALSGLLKPEIRENIIGKAEVRQVIRVPRMGAVAGSYILEGHITRGCQVRVIRDHIVIFEGSLGSLRRFKDDVREVAFGFECGIGIDRFQDFQIGDNIEGFVLEEIKRELA